MHNMQHARQPRLSTAVLKICHARAKHDGPVWLLYNVIGNCCGAATAVDKGVRVLPRAFVSSEAQSASRMQVSGSPLLWSHYLTIIPLVCFALLHSRRRYANRPVEAREKDGDETKLRVHPPRPCRCSPTQRG